jgi:glycosyltransferase involved in cell wall biosynthesis
MTMTMMSADLGVHVGAPHDLASSKEGVYGRDVVERDFVSALIRHGRARDVLLAYSANPHEPPLVEPAGCYSAAIAGRSVGSVRWCRVQDMKGRDRPLDVGVWHDADGELAAAAALRARFSKRHHPVTATVHVASYSGLMESWLLPLMLQGLHDHDALVATSRSVRQALQNLIELVDQRLHRRMGCRAGWKAQLPVIPLGVDTELFRPRDKREERRRLSLPVDGRLILWLGRLSSIDKADLAPLLAACRPLLCGPGATDVHLVVGGSGMAPEKARLERYAAALGIAEHVVFAEVRPSERHLFHAAADIFVSPVESMQETFGLTPIEAMACGVPQVVADWDGCRDTVVEGETGFRVPTYVADLEGDVDLAGDLFSEYGLCDHLVWGQSVVVDPGVLQARLRELLDNHGLRLSLGERSRRHAVATYDWRMIVRQYEALWSDLRDRARAKSGCPSATEDFGLPASFAVFNRYATRILDGTTRLVATTSGRVALSAPAALLDLLPPRRILDGALLCAVLQDVANTDRSTTLQAMEDRSGASFEVEAVVLRRHILWLVKQGFLALSGASDPASPLLQPRAS